MLHSQRANQILIPLNSAPGSQRELHCEILFCDRITHKACEGESTNGQFPSSWTRKALAARTTESKPEHHNSFLFSHTEADTWASGCLNGQTGRSVSYGICYY